MLSDDKPKIYWDACVPLSYINGYTDRLSDIEGLMQRSGQDFYLITSIFSIVEVAFAQVRTKTDKTRFGARRKNRQTLEDWLPYSGGGIL